MIKNPLKWLNELWNKLNIPSERFQVNYFFFGFLFLLLVFTHAYHLSLISSDSLFEKGYFLAYAIAELFLEIAALVLVSCLVQAYMPRLLSSLFVVLTFFIFLSHLIDFPLVRLMDMSIWFAYNFVADETYQNFIEMLLASNVSLNTWLIGGIFAAGLIAIGFFIYRFSEKLSNKYPFFLSYKSLMVPIVAIPLLLCLGDIATQRISKSPSYEHFLMTLPWKTTLMPPSRHVVFVRHHLKHRDEESEVLKKIGYYKQAVLASKPDMYIFIIESLREDFITPEIAPSLSAFKEENTSFKLALSNANATQISWFSLIYSKLPFYWTKYQPINWKTGSIPLKLFKQLGYHVHVYSSARLSYYQMDEILFGEGLNLVDSFHCFPYGGDIQPYESDEKTIAKLCEDVKNGNGSGNLHLIFLDSTHFDYSWPKETMTKFTPVDNEINYFKASTGEDIEGIKNRYRNAIYFIDSLFNRFMDTLKESPSYSSAAVVVTGDHGEEFYEQGHLFHASHLSMPQMHIPLYYRFGAYSPLKGKKIDGITTHMDVFPSLFDYLLHQTPSMLVDGESIFREHRWPYAVTARYNAGRNPFEFSIHNGKSRLIARFSNEKEIFKSRHLHIISARDGDDEPTPYSAESVKENFGGALKRIFSP